MSQCDAFGLAAPEAAEQVLQVIAVINTWRAHFASVGVSGGDLNSLAERLDAGELLRQRQTFDAKQFQATPAKRKPTSPFRRT
jgi:serine/threonine-protein kinase HipA